MCSRSCLSSAPSGSSISTRSGSNTSARASAMRCCCPPESCAGRRPEPVHLHHLQRALDLCLALGLAEFPHLEREGEILGHRHVRKQRVVLEHHPDLALVRRDVVDRPAVEQNLAMGGGFEPRQHHQAGRLARARRAQHGQKLALTDVEVQVLDDQRLAVIALLDPVENDIMVRPVGGCILRQNRSPCRASPSLMRRGCPFVKTVSRGCRESTRKYPLFFSQMPGAQPVCPKIVQRAKAHNRRATAAVDPAWCPAVKRSWCGWRDLNPHAFWAPEPKSGASANSATPALSGSGSA
jgi:hypothetical protein